MAANKTRSKLDSNGKDPGRSRSPGPAGFRAGRLLRSDGLWTGHRPQHAGVQGLGVVRQEPVRTGVSRTRRQAESSATVRAERSEAKRLDDGERTPKLLVGRCLGHHNILESPPGPNRSLRAIGDKTAAIRRGGLSPRRIAAEKAVHAAVSRRSARCHLLPSVPVGRPGKLGRPTRRRHPGRAGLAGRRDRSHPDRRGVTPAAGLAAGRVGIPVEADVALAPVIPGRGARTRTVCGPRV